MAMALKACNVPILAAEVEKCICIQGSMIGRADTNGPQGSGLNNEVSFTLNTIDRHAPKTEREAVQLAARREAADTVMKIYVQAMHKALGFGADRVAVVAAETEGNFRQFGECTKDGEYYGYAVLARKIGQIIHDTVEVDTSGATEPIFGKTLF